MSAGPYEVIQVVEPTPDEFSAALAEAGIDWPYDDILEHHKHPGLRTSDQSIGLVLHPLHFDTATDKIHVVQTAMVLSAERGIVARWGGDCLDEAFEQQHETRGDFVRALVEAVYDADTEAMEALEERVDDCELEVLDADGHGTSAQAIYHLEHELLFVRRAVAPMVSVLDRFGRKADADAQAMVDVWRDRYVRLVGQMEDIDSLLTSVLSVNLTLVSVRQNEDNRKIAAWAAIGIAPTAMAGIWGMNFEHMPELEWTIGYPLALGSIVLVCVLLYRNFRKAGWL